ncbi:hypothetical protein [Flavivirga eckloniae]|uniref:DUF4292 domain-containing protein n=1 Tax=Flavivirga eckloniae TaxID=1803846 RepID=A0A2K9PRA0_9FLAO|nr:hypothetical protein [Flavivirga eckloniae]AUP79584.1 hypothetical protein C1H87_13050 [Flavivirga eckloniae]
MRYLISSFCLLFIACGSYSKKRNFQIQTTSNKTIHNPYFSNEKKDYVYKANITVRDNNFGGILIVKKLGEAHHRIVFTTEMGNKIFDFSFLNDTFKVNFIIETIDKAILINILKKDFKALVQEKIPVIKSYSSQDTLVYETALGNKKHFYFKTKQLDKIARVKNGKEKVTFLFLEINDNIANQIKISHSNIKLKINLKSIN